MRLFATIERISTIQVLQKFLDHNIFLEISWFDSTYMPRIFSFSKSLDVSRVSFCPRMDLVLQIKTIHPIKHRNPHKKRHTNKSWFQCILHLPLPSPQTPFRVLRFQLRNLIIAWQTPKDYSIFFFFIFKSFTLAF